MLKSSKIAISIVVAACLLLFALSQLSAHSPGMSDRGSGSLSNKSADAFIHMSSSEKSKLLAEHFEEVKDANAFSDACKTAFANLTKEPAFSLANPGQPFQVSDAISVGPRLPWRRLIMGGKTSDRCVIYYEKGGLASSYQAVVIDVSNADAPILVWGASGGGVPRDISDLVAMITQGAFKQQVFSGW